VVNEFAGFDLFEIVFVLSTLFLELLNIGSEDVVARPRLLLALLNEPFLNLIEVLRQVEHPQLLMLQLAPFFQHLIAQLLQRLEL